MARTRHTVEPKRRRVLNNRELGHIRQLYREGFTQVRIAAEIGVSQATINRILAGQPKPDRKLNNSGRNRIRKGAPIAGPSGSDTPTPNYPEDGGFRDGIARCGGCLLSDLQRSPCPGHVKGYRADRTEHRRAA